MKNTFSIMSFATLCLTLPTKASDFTDVLSIENHLSHIGLFVNYRNIQAACHLRDVNIEPTAALIAAWRDNGEQDHLAIPILLSLGLPINDDNELACNLFLDANIDPTPPLILNLIASWEILDPADH